MDLNFILLLAGFFLVVFLLFKFMSKILHAIISLVFILFCLVASVVGLVYLDYNYLTAKEDFALKLLYQEDGALKLGVLLPVENSQPAPDRVSAIAAEELAGLDLSMVRKDSSILYIVVDRGVYENLPSDSGYRLDWISDSGSGASIDIDKDTFLALLVAEDGLSLLASRVSAKQPDSQPAIDYSNTGLLSRQISRELSDRDMSLNHLLFFSSLNQILAEPNNFMPLAESFKDGKLGVYPERFTVKLARMLPVRTIRGFLPENFDFDLEGMYQRLP